MSEKRLILFDFDGTITTDDSLLKFIQYYHGTFKFILGFILLSPIVALHLLHLIPNWKAKERVLKYFFKGERVEDFNARCSTFVVKIIPTIVRPMALDKINEYKKSHNTIAVVSASPENWIKPWCDTLGLTCISTKLEIKNGALTGKLNGANCFGPEKAKRIIAQYSLTTFDSIIAYGDSNGDTEMLALATEIHFKPFRN